MFIEFENFWTALRKRSLKWWNLSGKIQNNWKILVSQIRVDAFIQGGTLINFPKFSTKHALIPYHTFINFMKKFHIVCFSYSIFFPWRCRIITQIVSKCHDRANLLPNLQKFRIIEKISTKYTIIPPNMFIIFWDFSTQYGYSIPYVYFSGANVHPIRLFHTLRLLDTQEYCRL